ncbi:hypothetical protein DENSPDRAFT_873320 [Dentipellis sp. KUC8613]|nr:hypothetical protein DENSPDRAFT_873320 [Dentipellis sp. KUC8613]
MSHFPPLAGSDAAEQHVRRLDEEYQNLVAQLNSLTSRMVANRESVNSLAPISTLPTELLVHIFSFLSPSRRSDIKHFEDVIPAETYLAWRYWINVTHTCAHFRRVSIGDPSLWTVIYCRLGPEWTNLMLSRSRSLPVSVAFEHTNIRVGRSSFFPVCSEPRVSLIAAHRAHIKALRVNAQILATDFKFTWMLERLHGDFPLLEKLELYGQPGSTENEIVRIPMQYFQGMPALKELTLDNIVPSWSPSTPFAFSHLTTFDLGVGNPDEDDIFLDPGALPGEQAVHRSQLFPTLPQLLDVLETMPLLEDLSIHETLPEMDTMDPLGEPNRKVNLPRLKELVLSGFMRNCTLLAEHLDFPHTTRVSLSGNDLEDSGDDFPAIGRVLTRHFARQVSASRAVSNMGIIIRATALTLSIQVDSKPIWNLNVDCNLHEDGLELQFLRNAFATMPVGENASFDVVIDWGSETWNADIIEDLFRQPSLATVSSVAVCGNTLYPLCPALLRPVYDIQLGEHPLPDRLRALNVLPGLRDVIIMNVSCIDSGENERALLRDEIINVIRERKPRGTPLQKVMFLDYGSAANLEWLQSLKAVFPEIISWAS